MDDTTHKQYLNDKVRLIDGSHANAVTYTNIEKRFRCIACQTAPEIFITGFQNLITHCAGKKHQTNLGRIHELTWFKKKTIGQELQPAAKIQNGSSSSVQFENPLKRSIHESQSNQTQNRGNDSAKSTNKFVVNYARLEAAEQLIEKFDLKFSILKIGIESKYDKYRRDLNLHPQKDDALKHFWAKRHEELKNEAKINPDTYDYLPEFMEYFKKQVEIYQEREIENERKTLLMHFGITEKNIVDYKKQKDQSEKRKRSRSPKGWDGESSRSKSSRSQKSPNHSEGSRKRRSSQFDENCKYLGTEAGPSTSKSSHGGSSSKSAPSKTEEIFKKLKLIRKEVIDLESEDEASSELEIVEKVEKATEVTVTSVFRELAALEPEVGTVLAPRVINLLINSMQFEKIDSETCDKIMMNSENTSLIEAIREKLKVQIEMKLVTPKRVNAVQSVVENIQKLLKKVNDSDVDNQRKKADIMQKMIKMLKESIFTHNDLQTLIEAISEHVKKSTEGESDHESIEDGEILYPDNRKTENNYVDQSKENISSDDEIEFEDVSKDENNEVSDMTDGELKFLLENFKELEEDVANNLIQFLDGLEKTDIGRVKKLTQCVSSIAKI